MTNWIGRIVQLVRASRHHQVLLFDPDNLLSYPSVGYALAEAGYEVPKPGSAIELRVYFELHLRSSPDRFVILVAPDRYEVLPDLAKQLHVCSISLRVLFPKLDPAPLQGLSEVALSRLFAKKQYNELGEEATFLHVLDLLYQVDVDSLRSNSSSDRFAQALSKVKQHALGTTVPLQGYLAGLASPALQELHHRLNQLVERIADMEQRPVEWLNLMPDLAQLTNAVLDWPDDDLNKGWQALTTSTNAKFQLFLTQQYEGLSTLSSKKRPMVVSQLLDYVNAQSAFKTAIIVLDGMNFWQGVLLVEYLETAGIQVHVNATMAYIPTITAWSRQAIFRGAAPDLTADNRNEEQLFLQYWRNKGAHPHQIQYHKFSAYKSFNSEGISPDITRLALVCNDLDELMHAATGGNAQLRQATRDWLVESRLDMLLRTLKEQGFSCYITADHGSVEAHGIKSLTHSDKVGAISRSKRHTHFANKTLADTFVDQNPGLALGRRDLSLYLRDSSAFTTADQRVVTHGGSHLWEVIVPLLEI